MECHGLPVGTGVFPRLGRPRGGVGVWVALPRPAASPTASPTTTGSISRPPNLALGQTGAGQNNRRPQVRNYWEKMGQTGKRTKKDRCYITV